MAQPMDPGFPKLRDFWCLRCEVRAEHVFVEDHAGVVRCPDCGITEDHEVALEKMLHTVLGRPDARRIRQDIELDPITGRVRDLRFIWEPVQE